MMLTITLYYLYLTIIDTNSTKDTFISEVRKVPDWLQVLPYVRLAASPVIFEVLERSPLVTSMTSG